MAELEQLVQLVGLEQLAQLLRREALSATDQRSFEGKLQLLIVQPTPFCNLDCDYCYLPDRANKRRMAQSTLERTLATVFANRLPGPQLSVVWHAGEPLVMSTGYYRAAMETVARLRSASTAVTHHFQTNATLIDDGWCELFRLPDVRVGVSVDGPAWLHDRHRKTRRGTGTHADVMRGIEQLQRAAIPFHVICVLTQDSLTAADEIFDFFCALKPELVGFNVEEVEGVNLSSSLQAAQTESRARAFFARIVDRVSKESPPFRVREIDHVLGALRSPDFGSFGCNSQNDTMAIISVAYDGTFNTYSPELLGTRHAGYGSFAIGSMLADDPLAGLLTPEFRRVEAEVLAGVRACRESCKYFSFCRGGAPANKLSECGTFSATETLFCRLTQQCVVDVVLAALDRDLPD